MPPSIASKLSLAFLFLMTSLATSVLGADDATAPPTAGSYLVYVGTYTGAKSKGIYAWRMDSATGALTPLGLVGETTSPSFLDISPNHRFLYAVNEVNSFHGKPTGAVSAFSIDPATGNLTLLNQQTSGGTGPCHLTVDRDGKNVLVANYGSGSIESLPVEPDGSLGTPISFIQHSGNSINPNRQKGPHAHCMMLDAANHFALVCDLGLDKIMTYRFDPSQGTLTAGDPAFTLATPGAGPRHIVFHPDGRQAYVINEMGSTIVRYSYDPTNGALTAQQTVSLLPKDFTGTSTAAEVVVAPSGKFVYGSNRGDDSIAVFAIDSASGNLTFVQHVPTQGRTPRNIAIDPSGKFLFASNQSTANIVVFKIDPTTGELSPSGTVLEVGSPVCVKFIAVP